MRAYKMHPTAGEERFQAIWQDFVGTRDVYIAAKAHGEAVVAAQY